MMPINAQQIWVEINCRVEERNKDPLLCGNITQEHPVSSTELLEENLPEKEELNLPEKEEEFFPEKEEEPLDFPLISPRIPL